MSRTKEYYWDEINENARNYNFNLNVDYEHEQYKEHLYSLMNRDEGEYALLLCSNPKSYQISTYDDWLHELSHVTFVALSDSVSELIDLCNLMNVSYYNNVVEE